MAVGMMATFHFFVGITTTCQKNQFVEISTVWQKSYAFFFAYEVKISEFRKSEATCNHKTFDFTYWGTFSAPNSEVFVQTDFFLIFKNGLAFLKIFLVKILQDHNDTKKYWRIPIHGHFMAKSILKNFKISKILN